MLIHKGTSINLLDEDGNFQNLSCDLDQDRDLQEGDIFNWFNRDILKVVKINHGLSIDCISLFDNRCQCCEHHRNDVCKLEENGCQTSMFEQFSLQK